MLLGKVVGEVVCTQKVDGLADFKLALVEDIDPQMKPTGKTIVAVDVVNAGRDEIVLYVSGSSARQTVFTDKKPVDHTIVAIVDTIYCAETTTYRK